MLKVCQKEFEMYFFILYKILVTFFVLHFHRQNAPTFFKKLHYAPKNNPKFLFVDIMVEKEDECFRYKNSESLLKIDIKNTYLITIHCHHQKCPTFLKSYKKTFTVVFTSTSRINS